MDPVSPPPFDMWQESIQSALLFDIYSLLLRCCTARQLIDLPKPGYSSKCLLEFDTCSKLLGHHGRFYRIPM